jgi:hypothetical protein
MTSGNNRAKHMGRHLCRPLFYIPLAVEIILKIREKLWSWQLLYKR